MKGTIWTVTVIGVVLAVGLLAIPSAVESNANVETVTNETHTLTVTNETELNAESEWYRLIENETVRDAENGTVYERGEDYLVDYENGTLNATLNGSAGGDEVAVNYSYQTLDGQTTAIVGLLGITEPVLPLLFVLACFGALYAMVGWW